MALFDTFVDVVTKPEGKQSCSHHDGWGKMAAAVMA
jgi:hypothetical protein